MNDFELQFLNAFDKDLKGLEKSTKLRLGEKVEELKRFGRLDAKPVQAAPGCFSSYVHHQYRLIYKVEGPVIHLVMFCHRKDVYDRIKRRIA